MLDREEIEAKVALNTDLLHMEMALKEFLKGEIGQGLVTPFKMTLLVQTKSFLALIEKTRQIIPDNQICDSTR